MLITDATYNNSDDNNDIRDDNADDNNSGFLSLCPSPSLGDAYGAPTLLPHGPWAFHFISLKPSQLL